MPRWIDTAQAKVGRPRPSMSAHLAELPRLPKPPRPKHQPFQETEGQALARLAADSKSSPSRWASPWRSSLIERGLVQVLVGDDGLWIGDILTASGRDEIT